MRHPALIVFSLGVVVSSSAWAAAATLEAIQSPLSVSRGEGYQPVNGSTKVFIGDQVMAGPGGRGKIVYADGCAVDVNPGAVVTVTDKCYQPMRAGLEEPVARPFPWVPVIGALVVTGVGICAVACDEDGRTP